MDHLSLSNEKNTLNIGKDTEKDSIFDEIHQYRDYKFLFLFQLSSDNIFHNSGLQLIEDFIIFSMVF